MPPKVDPASRDKDLMFVWTCLQNSGFHQSSVNWNAVATALDIKTGAASMRWTRLKKSLEGAVPIAGGAGGKAASGGDGGNGFTAVNAGDDGDATADGDADGEPKAKKQKKAPANGGAKRKRGKNAKDVDEGSNPAKVKEEAVSEEEVEHGAAQQLLFGGLNGENGDEV